MSAILTAPVAVAVLVLALAGVAKLRAPDPARYALAAAGLTIPRAAIRILAGAELAVAALVLLAPGRAACALLAATYGVLALVAGALARRGAACGCFGGGDAPATAAHVALSAALALVAAAAVAWPAHGIAWLLRGTPGVAGPLALGIAGAAYATVLAYTELPAAWTAWRPQ
ncbi:MAG TPA: MauE/DoxX family redox-associated membrane protein [Solirubrobacteraceae bacterium]|nr:MauE/DoxX family redox-associated membrane protein [Solirubrobacteraceae bacterium]